jgi:hypothetical protein
MVTFSHTCRLCGRPRAFFQSSRAVAYVHLRCASGGSPPAMLWPYQSRLAGHGLGRDRVPPGLVLLHIKLNQAILIAVPRARPSCQHAGPPRKGRLNPNTRAAGPVPGLEGCVNSRAKLHRAGDRLDEARVIVLDVADARAYRPADHVIGRVGRQQRLEPRHIVIRAHRPTIGASCSPPHSPTPPISA